VDLAATLGRGEQPRKFYQALCEKLYAFAEWHFRNHRKLGDGATEGDHRASAARQFAALGIKPKTEIVAKPPEFPKALEHVWNWFLEIIQGVASNGWSVPGVTWTELDCWARLTGQDIPARDARTIIRLGVMRANILSEKSKTDGGKS
jgi:hypothetical protein